MGPATAQRLGLGLCPVGGRLGSSCDLAHSYFRIGGDALLSLVVSVGFSEGVGVSVGM